MGIAIAIAAILLIAMATVLVTRGQGRRATGELGREARRSDASRPRAERADRTAQESEGRARASETRAATGTAPVVATGGGVVTYEPVTEEELGVTRRHFLNLGLLAVAGAGVAALGGAVLAFIWPVDRGGFGSDLTVGKLSDILAKIDETKAPYYVPEARAYVNAYPTADVSKAEKAGYPSAILPSLEEGFVVQFQKCPHLGCRVPWCQTSQWFECPCHGSKYNRVGEKRDGPAPRGMSLVAARVDGGNLVIMTGTVLPGMPIGTDTTAQKPEGPSCI